MRSIRTSAASPAARRCATTEQDPDTSDRIGHGTAVAAAIREKAPDAELYAVKVFDRALSTTADRLVRAIHWAADAGAHVINLSLGTARAGARRRACRTPSRMPRQRGAVIVAAEESDGIRWLPGSLAGVIPVRLDWTCPRDSVRDRPTVPTGRDFWRPDIPGPIPGVPVAANLKGISFAVANVSGLVARAVRGESARTTRDIAALLSQAGN